MFVPTLLYIGVLSYLVSVPRRKSAWLDRPLCIVLAFCRIRVPKSVPLLELFSSKAGTFRFHRWKSNFPLKKRLDEAEAGADPMQEALDEFVT